MGKIAQRRSVSASLWGAAAGGGPLGEANGARRGRAPCVARAGGMTPEGGPHEFSTWPEHNGSAIVFSGLVSKKEQRQDGLSRSNRRHYRRHGQPRHRRRGR